MLVESDISWECEKVKPEDGEYNYVCGNYTVRSKSTVKFYLQSDTSYSKEWRYLNSEGHNVLLYNIEHVVVVPGNRYSVEIDAADMMSAPTPEALITSISEKVLVFPKPAATEDEVDMEVIEYYEGMLPTDYLASLKPLPTVILDGNYYNFSESNEEESCSICWGDKYSLGSRISSIQFLNEYLGRSDHHHDIIRMPARLPCKLHHQVIENYQFLPSLPVQVAHLCYLACYSRFV